MRQDSARAWENRREVYSKIVRDALRQGQWALAESLISISGRFAERMALGLYADAEIERFLLSRATSLAEPVPKTCDENSVLVVMSEAYLYGGHTRVVERWIENDRSRRYSLAVTRQGRNEFPLRLTEAVARSGGVVRFLEETDSADSRAVELRRWSVDFSCIVLHTHPDDIIPVLAYGIDSFPRPVGLYNHADHRMWLGASIADCVGELRQWGRDITVNFRGVPGSMVIGIPGDGAASVPVGREEARRTLKIREDRRLVVSAGAAYKYNPIPGMDFLDVVVPLLESRTDVEVVVLGVTFAGRPDWKIVSDRFGGRLKALNSVGHEDFMKWMVAADLVLNSMPLPGFTTISDAIDAGTPVLLVETPAGLMDWMYGSAMVCRDNDALVTRALSILSDRSLAQGIVADVRRRLSAERSAEVFLSRVNAFFSRLRENGHRIRSISQSAIQPSSFEEAISRVLTVDPRAVARDLYRDVFGKWAWSTVRICCALWPIRSPVYFIKWIFHGCKS